MGRAESCRVPTVQGYSIVGDGLDLPKQFGSFVLLRRLAVGGMAEVYVAKAKGIGGFEKLVAIKVIHPRYSEDQHFVQMLVEEAKISVLLTHVNVAQIFDLGCIEDTYFIVMEYIEGADAYRMLRKANDRELEMPIDVCAFVAAEVCQGLDYAHRKRDAEGRSLGIVHRDVSPQNVLISHAGEVKLVDFGIAKAALRSGQTEAGVIKGKYYYMSPEQAWADPVDHRSDIFSAGIVLYELLTGGMLYEGENIPELLDRVRKADIEPPHARRHSIPVALSDIVMRACAREPQDRFQSAHDMGQALTQFLYDTSPSFTAKRLGDLMQAVFGEDRQPSSTGLTGEQPAVATGTAAIDAMSKEEFAIDPTRSVIGDIRSVARLEFGSDGAHATQRGRVSGRPAGSAAPVPRSPDKATSRLATDPTTEAVRFPLDPDDDGDDGPTYVQAAGSPPQWEDETVVSGEHTGVGPAEGDGRPQLAVGAPYREEDEDEEEEGATIVDAHGSDGSRRIGEAGGAAGASAPPPPVRSLSKVERLDPEGRRDGRPPSTPRDPGTVEVGGGQQARVMRSGPAGRGPGGLVVPADAGGPGTAPRPAQGIPDAETVRSTGAGMDSRLGDDRGGAPPRVGGIGVSIPSGRYPAGGEPPASWAGGGVVTPQPAAGFDYLSHGAPAWPDAPPSRDPGPPAAVGAAPWHGGPAPSDPFAAPAAAGTGSTAVLLARRPRNLLPFVVGAAALLGFLAAAIAIWRASAPEAAAPTLEVISVPPGAHLRVDGQELAGATPTVIGEGLAVGSSHSLEVSLDGYETWSTQFVVAEGARQRIAVLTPVRATLRVETNPPGAEVFVDGVPYGRSPIEMPGLSVGKVMEVRAMLGGHLAASERVEIRAGAPNPTILLRLLPVRRGH